MIVFDGQALAEQKERALKLRVEELKHHGAALTVAAIVFSDDRGGTLYTALKQAAAERVGIVYQPKVFSLGEGPEVVEAWLRELNQDAKITGIIIQKPRRDVWLAATSWQTDDLATQGQAFNAWWHRLTSQIDPAKDVDGLHPDHLQALADGKSIPVLPATCQAVVDILQVSNLLKKEATFGIVGKSDLLGYPLFHWLRNQGYQAELLGKKDLAMRVAEGRSLKDCDVIMSATGQPNLITGELIQNGTAIIDVGEPRGDVDRASVEDKASFLTPVPGGVGPLTVVCLLENAVKLRSLSSFFNCCWLERLSHNESKNSLRIPSD